jgi:membrane protein DedA with SNARE-associated domain
MASTNRSSKSSGASFPRKSAERYFFLMNAIGGICWASFFGGGAYLFGEEIKRVTGPVGLLLLLAAIGLVITGILFFRHRERELEQRADAALRGM